jgi:hypothetical protein
MEIPGQFSVEIDTVRPNRRELGRARNTSVALVINSVAARPSGQKRSSSHFCQIRRRQGGR